MQIRKPLPLKSRIRLAFNRRRDHLHRLLVDVRVKKHIERISFDSLESILIFSEARGGSTWLMEMIKKIPGTLAMWEPLHPTRGVVPEGLNLCPYPEFSEDLHSDEIKELFDDILSYSNSNLWTRKFADLSQVKEADRVLVKFVRANLLLPWILENFNLERKPIVLSRHPLNTCISQIRAFPEEDWKKVPQCDNNDRYMRNRSLLEHCEDELEGKFVHWCLNNKGLFNLGDNKDRVIWVEYSDLLIDPKKEMKRIYRELGFADFARVVLEEMDFGNRSYSSLSKKEIKDPRKKMMKNFEVLSSRKKERLQNILDHFEIVHYSMKDPYPSGD